ncbi:MAG: cupin domain-containing protein [Oscillospiraceae bacterium]|jgi:mannose-1-phosphate guanylyltransferase|nr:cupin domain-containing protein [Oscillospiraceae bacterium]
MRIVLLSGGSGKRLWPLSNDTRSKQFLKLLRAPDGSRESMMQRVYRQIREAGISAEITVAASASQRDSIVSQLGDSVKSVLEPERRDTFPAIVLASAWLLTEERCSPDEVIAVLPVDPYTERGYFETIARMEKAVRDGAADIVLMGIAPTYASSKYGYIIPGPGKTAEPYPAERFVEKPTEAEAEKLIERGAMWNGGVFAFKLRYLMEIARRYVDPADYSGLLARYGELPKISFDYEVVEKAESVAMLPFDGEWKDLGTWNTLAEEIPEVMGNAVAGEGAENTHVINELRVPVVVLGVKDAVVVAGSDGILVTDKRASAKLKPFVDAAENHPMYVERLRPMYEERRWGSFKVIDYGKYSDGVFSLTKHLFIEAGSAISYQKHSLRDEIWTIVNGTGALLLDGHVRNVRRGDVAYITAGMKHAIRAVTDLRFIEVQIGEHLAENDIERFEWEW